MISVFAYLSPFLLVLPQTTGDGVPVQSAFVRVLDKADIPATEMGFLQSVNVKQGDAVDVDTPIASLNDDETQVALKLADIELQRARNLVATESDMNIAKATQKEAEAAVSGAELAKNLAAMQSSSTVEIQMAEKANSAAQAELSRAISARSRVSSSISDGELADRQFQFDSTQLQLKKAQSDAKEMGLKLQIEESNVLQKGLAVTRREHEVSLSTDKKAHEKLILAEKTESLTLAKIRQARRHIKSPLNGMVVEVLKHKGEWVEAGAPIARVIRLDRLKVEGFVSAAAARKLKRDDAVRIVTRLGKTHDGQLTFISPEIDSVNSQVRVIAEFDNLKGETWPGEAVDVTILPARK